MRDRDPSPSVANVDQETFADGWWAALGAEAPASQEAPERLAVLAERLAASLGQEPFPEEVPREVGRDLAGQGLSPSALRSSIEFLATSLVPPSGSMSGPDGRARAACLLGALAEGYAERRADSPESIGNLFENSTLGFALVDDRGALRKANAALGELAGRSPEELVGADVTALFAADGAHVDLALGKEVRTDAWLVGAGGESTAVVLEVTPLNSARRALVAVSVDETRSLRGALIRQSLNDAVTGLPNRPQFLGWLERAFAEGGAATVGLVHFDVDGFHVVNNALGHEAGDRVLSSVARRLRSACEPLGPVARTGADEFTLLVESPRNTLRLVELVEEVDELLAEPVYVDGAGVGVTVSVGISLRSTRGTTPGEVLRSAEVSARWSKEDGRARWTLYDPQRDARERERFTLAASVAGALEEGDIEVCYLPVFALPDRSLTAVEGMLRWNHPELGVLSQQRFLELSEVTGSAIRLGYRILEETCTVAAGWLAEFGERAPRAAVPLSLRQSREPELAATVRHILDVAALPPQRLQLLVEDDVLMALDPDQLEELDILVSSGVAIVREQRGGGRFDALADPGVPLRGLRVDGSVVRGLDEDAGSVVRSAVEGMLAWAVQTLEMDLIARGVRSASEAEALTALGVDAAQGPYFGGELTADEVRALLGQPN
ncbi:EAL domain-containing protein [Actinophytocola xanthii]|uniref:GGDEF domain-containing protein n=1 Tax=Actinophytocola xanthii TaxID=1912961 RepID=A0A1Q8CYW0_9PSEU|nr:EAL domain-containing protein [Actinophytocola xanthii]OLF19557.1 hypothetical protein BU204_01140 [Actinophytocola xanthii]